MLFGQYSMKVQCIRICSFCSNGSFHLHSEVYTVLLQGQQGALTLEMNPSSGIKDWSICSSCKKCSEKLEFMTCLQVWFCK
jgi:hypothetical protein